MGIRWWVGQEAQQRVSVFVGCGWWEGRRVWVDGCGCVRVGGCVDGSVSQCVEWLESMCVGLQSDSQLTSQQAVTHMISQSNGVGTVCTVQSLQYCSAA